MKKTNKWIGLMVALMMLHAPIFGQNIDEERMSRDLKVAENILGSLSGGNSRSIFYNDVESTYLPGYGVVFSIPTRLMVIATGSSGANIFFAPGDRSSYTIQSSDESRQEYIIKEEIKVKLEEEKAKMKEEKAKMKEEMAKIEEEKARSRVGRSISSSATESDELNKKSEEAMKEQMTIFLADYADLIGQLQPTDRIVVQTRGRSERLYFGGNNIQKNPGMSAQILKSELIAYKQGKMTRDELIKKIEFTSNENKEVAKDVELFSSIFARLYEPDLSSTYYTSARSIGYTKLDGFGITFNMKVYSSSSDEGLHTIRTTGESGLSQEERNARVNAMYPEFERTFKENLLDYGRTVKSLKEDEKIIFNVELTECKGCEMPEAIEVTVSGKTLKSYDSGDLSRNKAMEQIVVKKK